MVHGIHPDFHSDLTIIHIRNCFMNTDYLSEFLQLVLDCCMSSMLGAVQVVLLCFLGTSASPHAVCPCMNAKATQVPTYIKVTW